MVTCSVNLLVDACNQGDLETVREFLNDGRIDSLTEEGESLLSAACSAGCFFLVEMILDLGADIEDRGHKDTTPLMEAANSGHSEIVKLLIDRKASVNAQTSQGNTPLILASANGHTECVRLLLEADAKTEEHNESGHTALMEAASNGHVEVAKLLISKGASINTHSQEFKESALTLACYKGQLEMVKFLLSLSISSRIVVLSIQIIANHLITDHTADAYRNRYQLALTSSTLNGTSPATLLPDSYINYFKLVEGLTKWDAQYFLEISKDGYNSEQHLAFLPLYPIVISTVRKLVFDRKSLNLENLIPTRHIFRIHENEVTVKELEVYIQSALVSCVLNNFILFPIACISLFILTKLVKSNDEKYARAVAWWFCFNPASVFFSAGYSEAMFSALTFSAFSVLEWRSIKYLDSIQQATPPKAIERSRSQFQPLAQLNRILYIVLPALAPLALSTATRSNGLVSIGSIAYQFLSKYVSILTTNRTCWTLMAYICLILECAQDTLVLLMSSIFAASGYISFQIYSYIRFCFKQNENHLVGDKFGEKSKTDWIRPDWCNKQMPHPYGQVQAKYWNVGLFRYYEMKQLPNFLLAAPITYLILKGSLSEAKTIAMSPKGKKQLAYYMQAIMLSLLCSISINIQVVTRLIASSCPALYWICVDVTKNSRFRLGILRLYFMAYLVLGTILHVNYFPWT